MKNHITIELFGETWWLGLLCSLAMIIFPILLARSIPSLKNTLANGIGAALLTVYVMFQLYLYYIGQWSVDTSLPLHMCYISALLSGLVLFWRNQLAFEILLFWGIPGGIHSILTPELVHGEGRLLMIQYFMIHAGIVLSPLFLAIVLGMKPRKGSWLRVFFITQLFVIAVGLADYLLDANYMYLRQKPLADNPFVIGDWPYYIIGFELLAIVHFYLVYLPFNLSFKKSNNHHG